MEKIVAVLATDGVEEVELVKPMKALEKDGLKPVLIAPVKSKIQAMEGDIRPKKRYRPDMTLAAAMSEHFEGLVLPGGTVNADSLRGDPDAVAFVKKFVRASAPIAVICHGAWILIEAKGVKARTITSWPTLRTDLTNAGARWRDDALVEDGNMISSRSPKDMQEFCDGLLRQYRKKPMARKESRVSKPRPPEYAASQKTRVAPAAKKKSG